MLAGYRKWETLATAPFRPGFVSPPSTHKPTLAIRLRIALQVGGMSQRHWSIAGQAPSQQETIAMQHFYVRNGRRIQIPPTIQLLDEISPDYRLRLAREGRERVRAPRGMPDLPDLMHANDATRTHSQ